MLSIESFYNFFFISLDKQKQKTKNGFMNDSLGNLSRGVKFGTFTFFGTLIYEPQFRLSCRVIFSTFYNQLGVSTPRGHKMFQLLLTLVCQKTSSKNPCPRFFITFLLLRYWPIFHFCFL